KVALRRSARAPRPLHRAKPQSNPVNSNGESVRRAPAMQKGGPLERRNSLESAARANQGSTLGLLPRSRADPRPASRKSERAACLYGPAGHSSNTAAQL